MILEKKYMEQADLKELVAFFAYVFQGKRKESKAQWTIARLSREKRKYQSKGLPLPKALQGAWEARVWERITGSKYNPQEGSKSLEEVNIPDTPCRATNKFPEMTEEESPVQSPAEEKPPKIKQGNPFQSDSFGTLLEDWNEKSRI